MSSMPSYISALFVFLFFSSLLLVTAAQFTSYQPIGNKVSRLLNVPNQTGHFDVIIAYAGYQVSLVQSQAWAAALFLNARGKLGNKIAEVYAVGGPQDSGYGAKEIGNSFLLKDLVARANARIRGGTNLRNVYVMGHSSGSFVAHEFLGQVMSAGNVIKGKIHYFNLDGGGTGLTAQIISSVTSQTTFASAFASRTGTSSPNAGDMASLANAFKSTGKIRSYKIDANGSGCQAGAKWCLHMTLINIHPWSSNNTPDPAHDYTSFNAPHGVVTSYMA